MRKYYLAHFICFLFLIAGVELKAQLFTQDFTSSSTLADYINASPSNGQFNAIGTSGAGMVITINSNRLRYARTANAGSFSRTSDFSPTPNAIIYRFDLAVSGNSVAQTTAAVFQVGTAFGTANTTEANASTYARLGINFTTTNGTFAIRDVTGGTNSASLTGTQTITWALNNSGSSLLYLAPDGTIEAIANDVADIWAGTTRLFNDIAVQTTTQTITDLKFAFTAGTATIDIDNFHIDPMMTFYSAAAGDLTNVTSWGTSTDGTGTNPASFVTTNTFFSIRNRSSATISSNLTVSGLGSALVIGDGVSSTDGVINDNIGLSLANSANLLLNTSSTLTLNPGASLSVGSGSTANFNAKPVTLKSTATGTARIAQISGTLSGATNVTVERFIPTVKRAWRLVSSPVSATNINAAWQEGGSNNTDPNPGYGTHITGGVIGDGYDLSSTNAASLKTWTQGTNSWTNYTAATTAGDITDHKGYILFIRGHRGLNITGTQPAATTTTLRATGTLRQGDMAAYVTTGAASTDYTIMGNPYASPIDLGLLNTDHATIETFYSWDPNLAGTNGVGGYVLIQKNGADWDYTPQAGSLQTNNNARFLPSGAAIFVKSPGSAVAITMKESYKVADNTNLTYFRTGNAPTNLAINLNNSASETIDGIRVKFDDSYSNMVTAEDANKLNNEGENIAIRRNGMSLIVEKRQPVTQDDTLFIRLSGMQQNTAYELKFFPNDFTGINAFVEDTYLNTSTPLSLTGITTLNFSTDANVASVGDRFRLVFRPSSVLPVTFTAIRAQEKNGDVQLQWDVTNEMNTLSYVVERSKDGRTFNTVATVAATAMAVGEKHYQWLDMNASKGANFYRIKSVQNSNESKYTSVVKVTLGDVMGDINIYPNPVKNGRLSVQLNDLAEGIYEMRILNASGQVIMNRKLQHAGGSSVEEIILPAGSAKGIYRLQMLGTDSRITKTIVVE